MDAIEGPVTVTVLGDSREHVLEVVRVPARWGPGDRLFITWRGEPYPLRCRRVEGRDDRPEAWLLREDGVREDDEFYVFYDD